MPPFTVKGVSPKGKDFSVNTASRINTKIIQTMNERRKIKLKNLLFITLNDTLNAIKAMDACRSKQEITHAKKTFVIVKIRLEMKFHIYEPFVNCSERRLSIMIIELDIPLIKIKPNSFFEDINS